MKTKVVSVVLAVALCGGSFSHVSYAQDIQVEQEQNIVREAENRVWNLKEIKTDLPSPQEKNIGPITLSANISGDTEGLQYKFVWMKNNWAQWGVLQNFSEKNSALWNPQDIGKYTIYMDVKDSDGNVVTKTLSYEITEVQWEFENIQTDIAEAKKNENVEISAMTTGNTTGLQYKFVWMRDNWKEWGVLQNFSEKNTATWKTPDKSGKYTIYVDVKSQDGETRTKTMDYSVVDQLWCPQEIKINNDIKMPVYTKIPIVANVTGETQDLQYKYVWMKDNWKKWGVLQEFSASNQTEKWCPKEAGKYTIYVDIKDKYGKIRTIKKEYEVLDADWKVEKLEIHGNVDRFVGETLNVTAMTSGNTEGLQYKFVCRRGNDWSDWEVVQPFSSDNNIEIPLSKATDYHIYVDIKNAQGVICKTEIATVHSRDYLSAMVSDTVVGKGEAINIYPKISGALSGDYECKYVWMKDNWRKWAVIKDFSKTRSVTWVPQETGNYTIYIDVRMNGITSTKSIQIKVEEGYKAQLEEIKKYVYVPYVYGGTTTNGWDCSGFVQWSMKRMGVQLPRTSAEQSKVGTSVSLYNRLSWKPGDLLFYVNGGRVGHVALYLGDGMMMHALNPKRGTYITSVDAYSQMDKKNVLTYVKRVLKY